MTGVRGGGRSPGSSASSLCQRSRRRRRLVLGLGPKQVSGPARRSLLSVSFPRRHWAGRGAGPEEEGGEQEGAWDGERGGGGRALAQPAPPPLGPAGAVGPAGVASAPRGGGAGGLGPAPLRGGDCGGRLNGTRGRCRPQPYPKERGPSGQLGACEARHGGEADEPGWPRVYREGAGLVWP